MTQNSPFFSVIMPTYNRSVTIQRAIESVVCQSFKNWELIIIDDGSDDYDKTKKIIDSNFKKCQKIHYYKFPNMGANVARNIGLGLSKGKFIAFLDSDDEYTQGRLESLKRCIENTADANRKVYITDARPSSHEGSVINTKYIKAPQFDQILKSHCFFGGMINLVVHRNELENINGLDKNLKAAQDHDVYIRLLQNLELIYIPGEFVIYHTDSNNRISGKTKNKLKGQMQFYHKHKSKMNCLSKLLCKKKIALHAFYIKSPILLPYFPAWLSIWILKKCYNVTDERMLHLKLSKKTIQ